MREDDPDRHRLFETKAVLPNEAVLLKNTKRNKLRVTINLDRDVIEYFKRRGAEAAKGYQTLINDALKEYVGLGNNTDLLTNLVERVKRLEAKLLT